MILLVLIVALFLRLILLDQSLWLDEAINVVNAKNLDFLSFVSRYPIGDFHPPLYFALLWIWGHVFDFSEISVRIPSVILGVATVWLSYLLGKDFFGKKVGIISALLLAVSPLHVYYSQEARMYSLSAFVCILSFYFLIKTLESKKWTIFYILSLCLVLYSDYLCYLIFPAQFAYVIWCEGKKVKIILSSMLISALFLLPWMPIFWQQLSIGKNAAQSLTGWLKVVGGANIKELGLIFIKTVIGKVSIYNKVLYGLVAAILSALYGLILVNALSKFDNKTKLLVCWVVLPVVLAFIVSIYLPILAYFRMIFIIPGFYLLVGLGLTRLPNALFKITLGLVVGVSIISLSSFYLNPQFQREDWKKAVAQIDNLASKNGLIIFEDSNLPAPFVYYSRNLSPASAGLTSIPAKSLDDVVHIPNKGDVYLFEYLVDITDPKRLLVRRLENSGYKLKQTFNFNGVGFVYLYSKPDTI